MKPFKSVVFFLVTFFFFLLLSPNSNAQEADLKRAKDLNQQVINLYRQGQYSKAIPLAREVLAIREKNLGPEHPAVASSLNNLAAMYYSLSDYASARPLYKRALAIRMKVLGLEHPSVASTLNNLAELYRSSGDYSKARPLYERALAIKEKAFGPEHPSVALSLNNLAELYKSLGDYARARPLYQRALAIKEKALGSEHPNVATSLNNLATLYYSLSDYAKAKPLYQRALAIREKVLGSEHPDVAKSLNNLAELYRSLSDYAGAKPLYLRALAINEKIFGPKHTAVATSLNNLAELYKDLGDYDKAAPLLQRTLSIDENVLGPEHPSVAADLNNLACLYHSSGDYEKAKSLFQRALAINKKAFGPEHPSVAISLDNLAGLYSSLGDYAGARQLCQRALTIREKVFGQEHPDVAVSLNNLAELYKTSGDYAKAELCYPKALAINEKVFGPEHPTVAISLDNLAGLYQTLGDYPRAMRLYQRALAIREKALGSEHPDVATSLNHLAGLYENLGDYSKEEPLLERALAIREKALGSEHPDVAHSLHTLALLYYFSGDYSRAKPLNQRALAIRKKVLGPEHPDVANSQNSLASLYYSLGDYAKAQLFFVRALYINEKVFGSEHPDVANSMNNLAMLCAAVDEFQTAHDYFKCAQTIDEKLIHQVVGFTSESQKIKFLSTRKWPLYAFLSLVNNYLSRNPSARVDALNVWLKRKGVILEAQKRFQEALIYSDDSRVIKTFQELSMVRVQLSNLTFRGPGRKGIAVHKSKIAGLEKQKEILEARLAKLSRAFATRKQIVKADSKKVAEALPKKTVLIEFARIGRTINFTAKGKPDRWLPDSYLAFILHAGRGDSVEIINLGSADRIDKAVAIFKKEMGHIKNVQSQKAIAASVNLCNLIFEPLRKGLGKAKELFISPDGNLNLIPFEVLQQTPGGNFLIEDYTFNYLAAGRDVIGFGQNKEKGSKALFMGDPDFDLEKEQKNSILKKLALTGEEDDRITKRSLYNLTLNFKRLPGTREEVEKIAILYGKRKADVYTDREALEEVLWRTDVPTVLHLATHAFFLNDIDLSALVDERARGIHVIPLSSKQTGRTVKIENPLLRSGIVLAGANNALKPGNTERGDGIVTAEEILSLKLRGTDLVVLSACNTGLGEVKAGEGVYGLRRAFLQAGTRSLVMSMWQVPDQETKELMVEFYKNIRSGKMNRCQALRQAALKQMKIVKERYGKANPFFWGAFVFMGEP